MKFENRSNSNILHRPIIMLIYVFLLFLFNDPIQCSFVLFLTFPYDKHILKIAWVSRVFSYKDTYTQCQKYWKKNVLVTGRYVVYPIIIRISRSSDSSDGGRGRIHCNRKTLLASILNMKFFSQSTYVMIHYVTGRGITRWYIFVLVILVLCDTWYGVMIHE